MDIQDLKAEKTTLELALAQAIAPLIENFVVRTGLIVSGVSVPLFEVSRHGDSGPSFIIGKISVDIDL